VGLSLRRRRRCRRRRAGHRIREAVAVYAIDVPLSTSGNCAAPPPVVRTCSQKCSGQTGPLFDSRDQPVQDGNGCRHAVDYRDGVTMAEVVHEFTDPVGEFRVRAFAEKRGNVWIGWLEFRPKRGKPLKTGEETSQPTKEAVEYWATGLEPVYLEGAIERAK